MAITRFPPLSNNLMFFRCFFSRAFMFSPGWQRSRHHLHVFPPLAPVAHFCFGCYPFSAVTKQLSTSLFFFQQNKSLKLEIAKLKRRLLIQEDLIKRACERLEVCRLFLLEPHSICNYNNKVSRNMFSEPV